MSAAPQIEAVILDLFGVVIDFDDNIVYQRLAQHCAEPETAAKQLDGLMSGLSIITGRQSLRQTHSLLAGTLGLRLSFEDFVVAWNTPYSVPMPGMPALIAELSRTHKLLLLSNIDIDYWQAIRPMHPELDCFDALLVSGEIGLAKPDPAIFTHACEVAGFEPKRCLFIDDTPGNVEAARRVGLEASVFRGVPALRSELTRRGVLPPA